MTSEPRPFEDNWSLLFASSAKNDDKSSASVVTPAPEVSILMPFYRKAAVFAKVLEKNARHFASEQIELILMLDDPSEAKEVEEIVKRYPNINWQVYLNPFEHPWRNPAPVMNDGVRRANGSWILVCCPESEFCGDVPALYLARLRSFQRTYGQKPCGFYGTVKFLSDDEPADTHRNWLYYGSILFAKSDWERVGGYPEHKATWGADDDIFRMRLLRGGVSLVGCPEILLLHREAEDKLNRRLDEMFHLAHTMSDWEKQLYHFPQWFEAD